MSFSRALELARAGRRFLVGCHRAPDADALGSALGLAVGLRALGKEVTLYCPDDVPEILRFLPGVDRLERTLDGAGPWDACFVMDLAAAVLLPDRFPERARTGPVVVVDHHAAHDGFGDVVVREPASATAEIVVRMLDALGVQPLPAEAARPLYAALVADTGGFRYAGTTPQTLRLGARLLEAGADPWETAYHLFEDLAPERVALLRAVLGTLRRELDGRLALVEVTRAMLERTGARDEMVEGMVNHARAVRGVEVAALLWERPAAPGCARTKVSLRSRGAVDVTRVATALGGGGHRAAAGAEVDAPMDEVASRLVSLVRPLLP
ncbi:MAG: DHH family phosphoesterase [Myxococcota bacterium]|nr:DHH family phosphoesterase [Myxococcota bacterium]MDW8363001.1 DHH family phosphoesterase [Myxococcales bacterium]